MPRSPAALEALINELDEVRTLAGNQDDPALAEASLAVYRALSTLNQIGQRRFQSRPQRVDRGDGADQVVDDARRALARAREALARVNRARQAPTEPIAEDEAGKAQPGAVAVSCCGCGRRFFVQYVAPAGAALVAFPMACPWEECDAVTDAAYPEDAVGVEVMAAVR